MILALCLSVGPLAACSPEKPWMLEETKVDSSPLRIVESRHVVKKPLAEISDADVADAAQVYKRGGAGPIYVVVAFDDTKGKGLEHTVNDEAQKIARGLVSHGITQTIVISSIQLDAPIPVALIAFDTLAAAAPAECAQRPSIDQTVKLTMESYDYRLGCGMKTLMAQQIADPRDLEGKAGLGGHADGERLSNIINNDYRKGETHEFLPSYVISELAGE